MRKLPCRLSMQGGISLWQSSFHYSTMNAGKSTCLASCL